MNSTASLNGPLPRHSARRSMVARGIIAITPALLACGQGAGTAVSRADTARTGADSGKAQTVALTPAQLPRITLVTAAFLPYRPAITTTGTVAFNGDKSTQVLAPVSGPITSILVNAGSEVHRGSPLATVASPDFATALASYRKAQSSFRNAQRIADLDAQLFKNDAIARREMEQAQTDAAAAAADRDAAIEQMRALGVDAATIDAVRGNRAAPVSAAVIRAPISGTVVEKLVNPGQLIQAGTTPAFTIADLASVWVMASVFERDLALVAAGESAVITSGALPSPLSGKVAYIGSLVDPGSKATAVRVVVPNPHGILKRDMLVNVEIMAAQSRNAILIPTSAILRDDQNLPFVFLGIAGNRFMRRPVTLGGRSGDRTEVVRGVAAGERVVADGALFIQFAGNQ